MFLRRNTVGQTFVIPGPLLLVADGSAVTSSASVTVVLDGISAPGSGLLSHVASGAWSYTPTQTETDCQILGYVLTATGAAAVCGSVRTTNADPDDAAALGLSRLDAAVSAVFSTPTLSELGSVPSATPTPAQAIMLLYMALRNKLTVSATAKAVFNNAGTSIASKTLSDDGTTYTEAKMT